MDQHGQTAQKLKIGQKRQKLLRPNENNLERVFMTKKQNKIFFPKHFSSNSYKTLKTTQNLLNTEHFSKIATKLKVGKGR